MTLDLDRVCNFLGPNVSKSCGVWGVRRVQVFRGKSKVDELAGANSAGLKALVEKYSEPALPYEA